MSSPRSDTMSKDSKDFTESSTRSADSPRTEDSNMTAPTKISSGILSPRSPGDEKHPIKRSASDHGDESDDAAPVSVQRKSHRRADSGDSAVSTSQVCVCQPDPKIPRPPNAFILYRQHHQANLIAQYPGLKNPEISKIIGDQWRNQSAEVKNDWKNLAEEAKARHAQQYPDYKYQPKRNGRLGGNEPTSNTPSRCPKCGGRSIGAIGPPDSISVNHSSRPLLPPPSRSSDSTATYRSTAPDSERASPPQKRQRGGPYAPSSAPPAPPSQSYHGHDYHEDGYVSPEAKRRRLEYGAQPLPMPVPTRPPIPIQYPPPTYRYPTENPHMIQGRPAYHPPPNIKSSSTPPVAPPHHPHHLPHPPPPLDKTLTLPPIQSGPPELSVEETVMQMPYLGKVSLLGKIAPALQKPKPGERPFQTRGPLIAIEADDPTAIQQVVDFLHDLLSQSSEHAVRTFAGPNVPRQNDEANFSDYIGVVQDWHAKSREISEYITTRQPPMSERTRHDTPPEDPGRIPIVLLSGYSILASNRYSCSIAINDVYTVIDHWQWMATMWRGIVGPDVTVYIRDAPPEEMGRDKVEVREDARCVVLKREKTAMGVLARIDGGSLRRLGFEIGEWIRDVENMSQGEVEAKSRRPSP